jgi:hypothetical protein
VRRGRKAAGLFRGKDSRAAEGIIFDSSAFFISVPKKVVIKVKSGAAGGVFIQNLFHINELSAIAQNGQKGERHEACKDRVQSITGKLSERL